MRKLNIILIGAVAWSVLSTIAHAQGTTAPRTELQAFEAQDGTIIIQPASAPRTKLEAFEAQTQTVIVRGISETASVFAQGGTVSVRSKESKDAKTGRKEYGVAIGVKEGNGTEDTTIIDYDELDSLLDGIDYIIKIDRSVTALESFNAAYTTRGGLRIAVFTSNRRVGTIQAAVQSSRIIESRVLLASEDLGRLQLLIQEAKRQLDALRTKK